MKKQYRLLIISLTLLLLDQITKYLFFNRLRLVDRQIVQPAFNTGVSWSIPIPMIFIISLGLMALLAFYIAYQKRYFNRIVFSLLLAGTLGNMLDRVWLGGVRDFISVGSWFPIFNFADIYLNIGIIVFLYLEFFAGKKKSKS